MHLVLLFLALALAPASAMAHGVGARFLGTDALVLAASYSDGTPMAFAEALAFGPGAADLEFARGRTDAKGRFAFVPDRPGTWTITLDDGMGHALTQTVEWTEGQAQNQPPASFAPPSSSSPLFRAGLGASLLLNIFLTLALVRR